MRAVLINPESKTVTDIEVDGTLANIQQAIGCRTITSVYVSGDIAGVSAEKFTLYADDEGLFKALPFFSCASFVGQPITGNMYLSGVGSGGEETECPVSADDVRPLIKWVSREQIISGEF